MENKEVMSFMEAKGVIHYNMTNNYMFRYVLQENRKVLIGLICALLHLKPSDIKRIEITNPINLAEDIEGKEFILDIHVLLNNNRLINLEMQLRNEYNWEDRSLSYLCRSYDNLQKGQDYAEVLPVIHIAFMDYTLFSEAPEFYATYKMINVKNGHIYSDKFVLSTVDLTRIDLATEEDKLYRVDYWARLFKAKTWEEIQMLAKENEYLHEAADSIYKANADQIVRERCRAREDAEKIQRTLVRDYNLAKQEIAQKDDVIAQKNQMLAEEIISLCRELGKTEEMIKNRLIEKLKISDAEAQKYMEQNPKTGSWIVHD